MDILQIPNRLKLQWNITERCNWRCKHCYMGDDIIKNELNLEELNSILHQFLGLIKAWGAKGRINLTGGEPFVRKDFFDFLDEIYKNKAYLERYGIMTNGSFITKDVAKKIKDMKVNHVQVSLDGCKEINDSIRGKDTFEIAAKALKLLIEEGVYTIVSFTSSRINYADFLNLVDYCVEIGVDNVWTERLVPIGFGENLRQQMLHPYELKEFYENVYKKKKELEESGSKTLLSFARSLQFLVSGKGSTCNCGYTNLTIMPNGDVYPCRRLPIKVGNIKEKSLFEIYYSSELLKELRSHKKVDTRCKSCDFFKNCYGGEKCISYGYYQDPFAADPQCWKLYDKLPANKVEPLILVPFHK